MDNQPLPNCLSHFALEHLLLYFESVIPGLLGGCGRRQIRIFDKARTIDRCGQVRTDTFVKSPLSGHPGESRGPEALGIPGFRLPPE
jgi:hypothetical protein